MKRILNLTGIFSFIFFCSCNEEINEKWLKTHPQPSTNSAPSTSSTSTSNSCNCPEEDVLRLVRKIESDFTQTQNQLSSEYARTIRQYNRPEKRDNCTWVVTFKVSYPYGNTDGAHPDQLIQKRIACDGKEVYVQ